MKNYINGKFLDSKDTITITDKYTQERIDNVFLADKYQVEEAIKSSVEISKDFRKTSVQQRANYIKEIYTLLEREKDKFIKIINEEAGKPITLSKMEVDRSIELLKTTEREVYSYVGEMIPMDFHNGVGKTSFIKNEPLGVISAISPFNFPLNLSLHKIAPAIATGNCIILKPSPFTPLSALYLAQIIDSTSIPKGVVNIFLADKKISEKIITDDRINLFSFTGSPQIGWKLKNIAGKKKITLELGGNSPVIVDEVENLENIAKLIAQSAFIFSGQICISTQRIYVHKNIFEKFKLHLLEATRNINSGSSKDKEVLNSSMISNEHLLRVESWVKEAVNQGAEALTGGEVFDKKRNIYSPTILTNTYRGMKVSCLEVFGPVAILEKINSFDEGIEHANDSDYGLQAGVFTNNLENTKLAIDRLQYGGVIINNVPTFRLDSMPYGGIKNSGLGKEGIRSAMKDFTDQKIIVF